MALKVSLLEAIEMTRQLKDKLATLNRTRCTSLAATACEEVIHWLHDEEDAP